MESVINKTIRDLKLFGIIYPEDGGRVRVHLEQVYVAGFNSGCSYERLKSRHKKFDTIKQYNSKMQLINTFPSATEAGRRSRISKNTILKYCKSGNMTRKGHYWKYINK